MFFGRIEDAKISSEINWPLAASAYLPCPSCPGRAAMAIAVILTFQFMGKFMAKIKGGKFMVKINGTFHHCKLVEKFSH